ncbi:MAG TPA: hypothetical protein VJ921_08760 [Vicinamibacteria bacterium]|nr:hypothetical protein [Vicinamibacteria bacterium]
MRSLKDERGAISMGMIVGIFLCLFVAYEAKQFGPLLMRQFQFQDAVIEASKFSASKDAAAVQNELVYRAGELRLPISREMIKVTKTGTYTRVQIVYELSAEWLPRKPYKWTVSVDEESKIF